MARERDAATYSPAERAREKQASRDEDQRRLDAGEVTPAELQAENSLFHGVEVRPVLRAPRHVRLNDVEKQVAREFTFAAMSEVRSSIDFVMRALFTPLGCSLPHDAELRDACNATDSDNAPVAQLVRAVPCKHEDPGSTPGGGSE